MMVVDSSVWIAHLRGVATPEVARLQRFTKSTQIIVGDFVLLEVLQGCRDEPHAARVARELHCYAVVEMFDPARAVRAAANYRLLRSKGVTIRRTVDLIIGTFCIDHDFQLLHQDRDFAGMSEHLGLRIA